MAEVTSVQDDPRVQRLVADGGPSDKLVRILLAAVDTADFDTFEAVAVHRAARYIVANRDDRDVQLAIGTTFIDQLAELIADPSMYRGNERCECGHVPWGHWPNGQCAHCSCTSVQPAPVT